VSVSIVIPTKSNENELERCLLSIFNLDFPNFEVIVVDGHSQDNTVEIAKKYGCRVLYENKGTRAAAINIGVRFAKGEYVAFTDADAAVEKHWLANLVNVLKGESVIGAAMGRQLIPKDANFFTKCVMKAWQTFFGGGTLQAIGERPVQLYVDHPVGVNSIVKKTVFEQVGGLSEDLVTAEDVELGFNIRSLGYKIAYVSDAIVLHYRLAHPLGFFKRMIQYGYGRAQLFKKNRRTLKFKNLAPTLLIFLFAFSWLLGLFENRLLLLSLFYFLLAMTAGFVKGSNLKEKIGIFCAIILSHIGYGIGFIRCILKR